MALPNLSTVYQSYRLTIDIQYHVSQETKKYLIQLNLYQFQIREGKKKEIVRLREQFEADKKKIDRMRQERKFKPMNS